jgi:hypothetical protein
MTIDIVLFSLPEDVVAPESLKSRSGEIKGCCVPDGPGFPVLTSMVNAVGSAVAEDVGTAVGVGVGLGVASTLRATGTIGPVGDAFAVASASVANARSEQKSEKARRSIASPTLVCG